MICHFDKYIGGSAGVTWPPPPSKPSIQTVLLTFHSSAGAGNNTEQPARFYWAHRARKWERGGKKTTHRDRGEVYAKSWMLRTRLAGGETDFTPAAKSFHTRARECGLVASGRTRVEKADKCKTCLGLFFWPRSFCSNITSFLVALSFHASVKTTYLLSSGRRCADVIMKKKTQQPRGLFSVSVSSN